MKEKIIFDPALSNEGDNIGAYLKDSAGNLLTSTLVSGKQSLDVNVTQSTLPLGAATEASLALVAKESTLQSVDTSLNNIEASSAASQSSLASIDSKISIDGSGNIRVVGNFSEAVPNTAIKTSAISVSNTATLLLASSLANRQLVKIQNAGGRDAAIGTSSVSFASGYRLSPGASLEVELGPNVDLYGITNTGSTDIRVLEVA